MQEFIISYKGKTINVLYELGTHLFKFMDETTGQEKVLEVAGIDMGSRVIEGDITFFEYLLTPLGKTTIDSLPLNEKTAVKHSQYISGFAQRSSFKFSQDQVIKLYNGDIKGKYLYWIALDALLGSRPEFVEGANLKNRIGIRFLNQNDWNFYQPIDYDIAVAQPTLENNDGSITISVNNASGTYQYRKRISGQEWEDWQNTNEFQNLSPNSYEVQVQSVTDNNFESIIHSAILNTPLNE